MLLLELFESSTPKHAAFCFGRMNPPTLGHGQLINTVAKAARGGDYFIFVSQTQDKKKNPLDYATKIKFINALFPDQANHVVYDPELKTIMQIAQWLYNNDYRDVTFVAGSDRLESFEKLLNDYNGREGGNVYYKFDTINFVSSGERDPDADGIAGISASGAREAATAGDINAFAQATGAGKLAQPLYDAVRKGMLLEHKTYTVEDFNVTAFTSIIEMQRIKMRTGNKQGMPRYWPSRYAELTESKELIESSNLSDAHQYNIFKEQFQSQDERNKIEIKVGNTLAILSATGSLKEKVIELDGFVTPKKIVYIGVDSNDKIDFIEFDDGQQFPSKAEFTTVGKQYLTNTIFLKTTESATKAYTATWMMLSGLEGHDWTVEHHLTEDAAGVGVVASNKKMAKDPRYSMSITKDVGPNTPTKNARAFRLIK